MCKNEDLLECPYCHHKQSVMNPEEYDLEHENDENCGKCGKDYAVVKTRWIREFYESKKLN